MNDNPAIAIGLTRRGEGQFRAINSRGATLDIGNGAGADFSPVELLLAALAGCSAFDVDHAVSRHSKPESFEVTASGVKVADDSGNSLANIQVKFSLTFEDSPEGEIAQQIVSRAVDASHNKFCTVARTVEAGEPVSMTVG